MRWNFCTRSISSWKNAFSSTSDQRPATCAGTRHRNAWLSATVNASSGSHSPMSHMCETMRVPGFIASSCGRSW